MLRDLTPALDLLDLAIASSDGLASDADRDDAATLAAAARRRRDYLSGTIVVAIAGGTGSGKSSLLNALAGREVVSTSALRPHTDEPLAWIPANDPVISSMMEAVGIEAIVEYDGGFGLAIVDLPDLDSVNHDHRSLVEETLPLVDAVIWMFDPIKYHDPSIHGEFLAEMIEYEPVFIFALNKIDLLDEAEAEAVEAHLGGILKLDGFHDPEVIPFAAAPSRGEPIGVDKLKALLERVLVDKRADRVKLVADILRAGRRLASDASVWTGTPDDAHEEIRGAAGESAQLAGVLDRFEIEGPLRLEIESSSGETDSIDIALKRRAELAATVAALGVACAEIANDNPGGAT
ncbi:MAG: 50S ribosome-binding GTPase [Actinomycetia bacterium]|nr:50S ribosome-binding GTPase [Actinomycetes bacterium]